ncbi:hypothetical protein GF337_00260 [candidate division KSB1 bacterium]|nr:hypothetical protein [candidate division KSB1 bacterium]
MKLITSDIVEKTWQEMSLMPPDEFPKVVDQMIGEQPVILSYLMTACQDLFNQTERQLLIYMGVVIWKIMLQGDVPLKTVTEKKLDEMEDENFAFWESIDRESDEFIDSVTAIAARCNQPEVLRYVVEAIMEDMEYANEIRDENKAMMMLYLKTVIDCFDQ